MQFADAIAQARRIHRQMRHIELTGLMIKSQRNNALFMLRKLAKQMTEIMFHHPDRKGIMTRGNRRMGRKYSGGADGLTAT